MACIKCKEGFWLFNGIICIEWFYTSNLCLKYKEDDDGCLECAEGSFLEERGICIENPSGITGCINYSDPTTCTLCNEDLYLAGNECINVENKIENCWFY